MSIPGLALFAGELVTVVPDGFTTFDLASQFGSPAYAIQYKLYLWSGDVAGGPDTSNPAIDASGLHVDSTGIWVIDGDVIGVGGVGGNGGRFVFAGGGGGAGAGCGPVAAAGGTAFSTALPGGVGSVWPVNTGGSGGADGSSLGDDAATLGAVGGDAILLNHAVTINLSGTIGGGGGGGDGALGAVVGGDGGALGVDGDIAGGGSGGGAAGYAIRYSGSGSATVIGGTTWGTIG